MGHDRLLPVVLAAQRGHECAYAFLTKATVGLVRRVYDDRLVGLLPYFDWESEALIVLLNAIRCFDVKNHTARFSTYYMQSLLNKATDLKRKENSQKEQFQEKMLTYETTGSDREMGQTNAENPEELFLLKETIEHLALRKGQTYACGVAQLTGEQPLSKGLVGKEKRQLEQVQYHFKKLLQQALEEGKEK